MVWELEDEWELDVQSKEQCRRGADGSTIVISASSRQIGVAERGQMDITQRARRGMRRR